MTRPYAFFLWSVLLTSLFAASCTKATYHNPYDDLVVEAPADTTTSALEPGTLAWLHAKIFRPTCANSGCHDGTFEPDFRTIHSTWNTTVWHPVIKNDPQNSFMYRIVPGDVAASQLVARLTYDIDGQSGVMPLAVEPDSDWPDKKDAYIQAIKDWIAAGAPRD